MIFFPVGVEDLTLRRIPWASIVLAVGMALGFLGTWVFNDVDAPDRAATRTYEFWWERPHLALPEDFRGRYFDEATERDYAEVHERAVANAGGAPDAWAEEQARLDALAAETMALIEANPLMRFALVPARGPLQPGWLTHMFVHIGWMHLLGNLLFFYIVALLLEDIWGRWLFPAFYVAGGLVAAFAHVAISPPGSAMAGASGAIAACMGAFAVRFMTAKIRMGYFFILMLKVFRGTIVLPAWLLGLLWFGSEVLDFTTGAAEEAGVAVMAHIGGFVFGAGFALLMKRSGVEERYIARQVEREHVVYERHPQLDRAEQALAGGRANEARAIYEQILREAADNVDAQVGLARLDVREGRARAGMERIGGLFRRRIQEGTPEKLWPLVEEVQDILHPELLPPVLAKRVADEMRHAPEGLHRLAEPLYAAAGQAPGRPGAVALGRAAEVAHANHRPIQVTLDYLARARAKEGVDAELANKLAEQEARARQPDGRAAIDLSEIRATPDAAPPPEVAIEAEVDPEPSRERPAGPLGAPALQPCALAGLSSVGLKLVSRQGGATHLSFGEVLAVAVGVAGVPQPNAPAPRQVLFTDLITAWGEGGGGPTVLRVPSHALGLASLYPALPPAQAYGEFLRMLLDRTGAHALPDPEALRSGRYPRFADVPSMNAAIYERA